MIQVMAYGSRHPSNDEKASLASLHRSNCLAVSGVSNLPRVKATEMEYSLAVATLWNSTCTGGHSLSDFQITLFHFLCIIHNDVSIVFSWMYALRQAQ